jgi:hypothetical protein
MQNAAENNFGIWSSNLQTRSERAHRYRKLQNEIKMKSAAGIN